MRIFRCRSRFALPAIEYIRHANNYFSRASMEIVARAISGAAMLLAGAALTIFGLLFISTWIGICPLVFGLLLDLCGFCVCCRVGGVKVYAAQAD